MDVYQTFLYTDSWKYDEREKGKKACECKDECRTKGESNIFVRTPLLYARMNYEKVHKKERGRERGSLYERKSTN